MPTDKHCLARHSEARSEPWLFTRLREHTSQPRRPPCHLRKTLAKWQTSRRHHLPKPASQMLRVIVPPAFETPSNFAPTSIAQVSRHARRQKHGSLRKSGLRLCASVRTRMMGAQGLAWVDTTCEGECKGAFKNQRRKGFEDMITVLISIYHVFFPPSACSVHVSSSPKIIYRVSHSDSDHESF